MPTDYAIKNGRTVFDATLYTGNGSTQSVTNAGKFQPDLVWTKGRSNTGSNCIQDTVRGLGATKKLSSNSTNAENNTSGDATDQIYGYISAVTSTGFTAVNGSTGGMTNASGVSYVAWQWQAGQGTNVTNTSGSITSTVSVNANAGFSVVTYTIPASGTGWTVGHGLGVAPSLIIAKARSNSTQWSVYHSSLGNTKYLRLNTTDSALTDSGAWNDTSPSSTVFTNGSGGFWGNSYTYVAYCWAEIAGFSKFGSYTGNGSADGPFVYTGFRPKFILWKSATESPSGWNILDTSRDTNNVMQLYLNPNSAGAEGTYVLCDALSNGFKLRTSAGGNNASGQTYIYACFAENPFKYSNAR